MTNPRRWVYPWNGLSNGRFGTQIQYSTPVTGIIHMDTSNKVIKVTKRLLGVGGIPLLATIGLACRVITWTALHWITHPSFYLGWAGCRFPDWWADLWGWGSLDRLYLFEGEFVWWTCLYCWLWLPPRMHITRWQPPYGSIVCQDTSITLTPHYLVTLVLPTMSMSFQNTRAWIMDADQWSSTVLIYYQWLDLNIFKWK